MFVNRLEQIEQSCGSFGQTVSEEKILKKITHQRQELPIAAMFLTEGVTMSNLYRGLLYMLPTKLHFIWGSGFRRFFQQSTNQKQDLPVVAMFVYRSG
jgi:hypothetical protein